MGAGQDAYTREAILYSANQYAALAAEAHMRAVDNDHIYDNGEVDRRARDSWWRAAFILLGAIK